MNKKLFLLPLIGLLITGCNNNKGEAQPVTSLPDEFEGYRRLTEAPEDGQEYVLGFYQQNLQEMCFMNGNPHEDDEGTYPFYLATNRSPVETTTVLVEYVDDTYFTMKVSSEEEFYNDCYLFIYEDGNHVSIGYTEDVSQDHDYQNDWTEGVCNFKVTNSHFFFANEVSFIKNDTAYNVDLGGAPCVNFKANNASNDQLVALGGHGEYEGIEAYQQRFMGGNENFSCFFWEKI